MEPGEKSHVFAKLKKDIESVARADELRDNFNIILIRTCEQPYGTYGRVIPEDMCRYVRDTDGTYWDIDSIATFIDSSGGKTHNTLASVESPEAIPNAPIRPSNDTIPNAPIRPSKDVKTSVPIITPIDTENTNRINKLTEKFNLLEYYKTDLIKKTNEMDERLSIVENQLATLSSIVG